MTTVNGWGGPGRTAGLVVVEGLAVPPVAPAWVAGDEERPAELAADPAPLAVHPPSSTAASAAATATAAGLRSTGRA